MDGAVTRRVCLPSSISLNGDSPQTHPASVAMVILNLAEQTMEITGPALRT